MRKHRKLLLFAVCLTALVSIGLVISSDSEPRYQGRSLYEWLLLYNQSLSQEAPAAMGQQATIAVRSIGTNALPSLLRWLRFQPSSTRHRISELVQKLPAPISQNRFVASLMDAPASRFQLTVGAFDILRAQANPAIPALNRLMNDTNNPYASQQAAYCLAFIGADAMSPLMIALADSAFPYRSEMAYCLSILRQTAGTNITPAVLLLAQCATNKDEYLSKAAVEALGLIALSPDISLPPILHAFQSPNPMVRMAAARSVARFGAQGRAAIPALLRACNDSDVFVRYAATNSLHAITSGPLHD